MHFENKQFCSLFSGLAAASSTGLGRELKFDAGKEYLFQYSGRLMSGIPELANQVQTALCHLSFTTRY